MRNLILFSGGLDSFITVEWVDKFVQNQDTLEPVFFFLGTDYSENELSAVLDCNSRWGIECSVQYELEGLGLIEREDGFIPNRNAHLILAAAGLLQDNDEATIWLTVQEDEMDLNDRTSEFFESMNALLKTLGYNATVKTPWAKMDKTDMVRWALKNGSTEEELISTWSCYSPVIDVPCGNCPACFRRWVAFYSSDIKEEYATDPAKTELALSYLKSATLGEYSDKRSNRIKDALWPLKYTPK